MNKKNKFWLWLIIGLGLFLRVWKMGQAPWGLNADEAALGYNAYSLLKTGMDEHGHPWPLHFESFADFKPGGYVYLLLPLVAVFGLQVWVVRLPSLVAGVVAIWLIYKLVDQLTKDKSVAMMSAFLLSISPWHIQFSRAGWETNVGTSLLLVGSWLGWRGLEKRKFKWLIGGLVALVSSAYVYHSMRLLAPILLLTMIVLNWASFWKFKKKLVLFFGLGLLISLPLLIDLLFGGGIARAAGVSLRGDVGPFWATNRLRGEHTDPAAIGVQLLHNKYLSYGIKLVQNWANHFDPEFLFIDGDKIRRSNCPGIGQLYWLEVVGLLAGLVAVVKKWRREYWFVGVWLVLAPLPAALSLQSPHALRSQSLLIPLLILVAQGWIFLAEKFKKIRFNKFLLVCFWLVYAWQVGYFLNQYLVQYAYREPQVWEGGFDQLVPYLDSVHDRYSQVWVTEAYDQPYILFLFYLQYSPEAFQKEAVLTARDRFHFSTVRNFDNYHFESVDWDSLPAGEEILVVGTPEEVPPAANVLQEIYFPHGQVAFRVAER